MYPPFPLIYRFTNRYISVLHFSFLDLLFRAVFGIDKHAECIVFNRAENFVAEHFL